MKIDTGEYSLLANQRSQINNATHRKEDVSAFAALLAANMSSVSPTSQSTTVQTEAYDFTHITPTALHESVNRLIRSGQLDLDQTTPLVGMMASTELSTAGGLGASSLGYSNAEQPMNVFNRLQQNMAVALSLNDRQSADNLQGTIDALRRLQGQSLMTDVRA
ncbi:conserved hypothetical protein [Dickeya parazeae Ech586]|uniref:Uncharacterized protein n=1 Tax=Dickeya zeae (strain Ech586) TaxID=590409 RepID=D2C056_DICZ5|nr:hypothetical protein [Dickeya parazeae]ACZ76965.1 conserved hypothetical protein [Dickeya parazeae Ech586]